MNGNPFNIMQLLNGNFTASNGMVTVNSETPCVMRRRRAIRPGTGLVSEMLYAELPNGVKVYVKQLPDNSVKIVLSERELYL